MAEDMQQSNDSNVKKEVEEQLSPSRENEGSGTIEEGEMLACPSCGIQVAADAPTCPGCGALFEAGEEPSPAAEIGEEDLSPPSEVDLMEGPQSPDIGEEDAQPIQQGEDQMPVPSVEEELHRQRQLDREGGQNGQPGPQPYLPNNINIDQRVVQALQEYSRKRRSRYMMGSFLLGLGIVFFVLLWLVTVYQVLVVETDSLFAADIIGLLIGAGILFIAGLYMILSYPKSSLVDIFARAPGV
ncbi:MAG: zinc ribbon domain-containing protein [Thermoplasmata archaeon]|nr:MAG: zinc ribbon domain-containing protein [Thermoplasmata archaeon]